MKALPLSIGLLAAAAAGPSGASPVLPPHIASTFEHYLDGFEEPALWRPAALRGYRTRIRLTIRGPWPDSAAIRIDERAGGAFHGHATLLNSRGRTRPRRVERDFPVARDQFLHFEATARSARIWTTQPQFWAIPEEEGICVAGMVLIFERADADGYRFTTANWHCNAPDAMRDVAEMLIGIARIPHMRGWLG